MTLSVATCVTLAWVLAPSLRPQAAHPVVSLSRARLCTDFADFELDFGDSEVDEEEEEEESSSPEEALAARRARETATEIKIDLSPNATVASMQQQLKHLGQKHTGSKPQLLERLRLISRKQAMGLPINDMEIKSAENLEWYMLQTANGFEGAVERTINMMVHANRMHDEIEQVFVPLLEGESSVRESSVMPSYIFVRMRMTQELHFLISSLNYVVSFVGADRGGRTVSGQMQGSRGFVRPMPMSEQAFEDIVKLTKQNVSTDEAAADSRFAVDDMLQVLEGPFKGLQGPVLEIGEEGETLTLALTVMGRDTPVDLPLRHVVKMEPVE